MPIINMRASWLGAIDRVGFNSRFGISLRSIQSVVSVPAMMGRRLIIISPNTVSIRPSAPVKGHMVLASVVRLIKKLREATPFLVQILVRTLAESGELLLLINKVIMHERHNANMVLVDKM